MSQDDPDDPPPTAGGLFSKVVRFVRHPTTQWGELDQPAPGPEDPARQSLKEMIVRKKRNDFVRQREFDLLRKLRNKEMVEQPGSTGQPSFFQSSFSSNSDERAQTLKKIDEIEAQMSMQWWKTKDGATTRSPPVPTPGARAGAADTAAPAASNSSLLSAPAEPTSLPVSSILVGPPTSAQPPGSGPMVLNSLAEGYDVRMSDYAASRPMAVEVAELLHDPELEEAAIRFANSDDAGAESALLEALAPQGPRHGHADTWLALFDFYRATGAADAFERAALDFAREFGRSAPQWFSIPAQLARMAVPEQPAESRPERRSDWAAPALLGARAVQSLASALAAAPGRVRLDWLALEQIEPDAAASLLAQLAHWRKQPVEFEFMGAERLVDLLRHATPSCQPNVNPVWWRLRMEVCRVMLQPEEFELVALDYCVTFEVSPPSWEQVACIYIALDAEGKAAAPRSVVNLAPPDSTLSGMSTLRPDSLIFDAEGPGSRIGSTVSLVLAGHVTGDVPPSLRELDARWQDAEHMQIDCGRLTRVDFSAAGALLNWVAGHHAAKRTVQFNRVHRVLAPFFAVIGISEYAVVVPGLD